MKVQMRFEGGEIFRDRAASLAPVAPGAPDLAKNIGMSRTMPTDRDGAGIAVGPTTGFFYGFFQEYGTVHHGAQPFMRPAFDSETSKVLATIAASLWRELAARGAGVRSVSGPRLVSGPGPLV